MEGNSDGFELIHNDEKSALKPKIWKKDLDTGTIEAHTCFVPGATKEAWQWAEDGNMPAIMQKVAKGHMTLTKMPDHDMCHLTHVLIKIPIPLVSNRQIFSISWREWPADDEFIAVSTSEGLDEVIAANKDKIGKDVLAT